MQEGSKHHKLALDASLGSQLAGKTIIEYPTLLVLLSSEVLQYALDGTSSVQSSSRHDASKSNGQREAPGVGAPAPATQ